MTLGGSPPYDPVDVLAEGIKLVGLDNTTGIDFGMETSTLDFSIVEGTGGGRDGGNNGGEGEREGSTDVNGVVRIGGDMECVVCVTPAHVGINKHEKEHIQT